MHTPYSRCTALLRLTRWNEHVLFTLPATLLGINLSITHTDGTAPDSRALIVVAANVLAVAFAFMINDIEDAQDDARDPVRGARNAVSTGQITPRTAWIVTLLTGIAALMLFALAGPHVLVAGALTVGLSVLYSWRPVRLKALPLVDVIAHVLMLAALLFLAGYVTYSDSLHDAWIMAAALALISAYGQLYNQLRDYDIDRLAGLRNSASILGQQGTQLILRICLVAAGVLLITSIVLGYLPLGFVGLLAGLSPLLVLLRSRTDMRGTLALDAVAQLQTGAMVITTLALVIWFGVLISA